MDYHEVRLLIPFCQLHGMVHAYMISFVHVQETRKLSVAAGGAGPGGDKRGLPGSTPAGMRAEPHASKLLPFIGAA